jgi:A118 family predicted phage portal protein
LGDFFPDLAEETRFKGLRGPLFVYFKPNIANNIDDGSPLGVSVFANALDTLRALDICFDSFTREFVLGKKRVIVPSSAVRSVVDSSGRMRRYFDAGDEVYQAMAFENPEDMRIVDNTTELRVDEHIAAINALLGILAFQTGLTAGTLSFGLSDGVIKTATEVVSENSKTFKTVKSHENVIGAAISALIDRVIEVSRYFGVLPEGFGYQKNVRFDDSIVLDRDAEIDRALKLVQGGLLSRFTVMVRDLGFTEEGAREEIDRIRGEEIGI